MHTIQSGLKRVAAMVVLRHEQQLLLLRRAKPPHVGKYVPVGGKLDPFERPVDAARRETFEETGIAVKDLHYCGVLTESSPVDYNWICYIYLADIDFQAPPPCDEGILEWVAFDDLASIPTPPTDLLIYQYLVQKRVFALDALYDEALNLLEMTEEITGERVY
ncbi:MAG: NUDIX domain-containing protein [Saprospiraceae bacterium]|nr:NUDIX domain-containing protein [Saprospiraceae bacterium]